MPEITWEAIGILIAAFFSFISGVFAIARALKERGDKKRETALTYITNSRIQWIGELRNTVTEFIEETRPWYFNMICFTDSVTDEEMDLEHDKLASRLTPEIKGIIANKATKAKLLMNFSDRLDKDIIDIISKIQGDISMYNFQNILNDQNVLLAYIQIYLKLEWNRVKYEATNKYTEEIRRQELISLCKKMSEDSEDSYVNNALKKLMGY